MISIALDALGLLVALMTWDQEANSSCTLRFSRSLDAWIA